MSEATTIRLEDVRRFRRRLLQFQVYYDSAQDSSMTEIYEALIDVAFDHHDEVAEKLGGGSPDDR